MTLFDVRKQSVEFGSGGEGVERRDGFDETGDREGIADAAGLADEMKRAAFAGERNRDAHQRGDAGAVDLRDAVQVNDHFAAGFVEDGLQRASQLIAGFADGEATVHIKNVDAVFVAYVDFDWGVLSHFSYQGLQFRP
jgi:hypothetical protein